jgi:hypothetical protein
MGQWGGANLNTSTCYLTYLQDSQFTGFYYSIAAIANLQFAVNVAGVPFHCVHRQIWFNGDLLIG